jgi:beta-lactamase family protein
MSGRRHNGLAVAAVLTAAALVACEDDGQPPPPAPPTTQTTAPPETTTSVVDTTLAPDTTLTPDTTAADGGEGVRAVLDEIIGWMADPGTVDPDRFSDQFLAEVPAELIVATFEAIGVGEWNATQLRDTGPNTLEATLVGPQMTLSMQLHLGADGRIDELGYQPGELTDPPETLTELTEELAAFEPHVGFLRAEIGADGECVPVASLSPDQPLPLGSTFKLYVLGAVAAAIAAGDVTWDQPVEMRDERDSLPSGITQDEPVGTTLSVRELAQRMIEFSDNTATDYLIELVGRDAVEAALADLGHSDPAITLPFLTTRELFIIKADADLLSRYAAADTAERRELLDNEVAAAPLPELDLWIDPREVRRAEWFASPNDVCRALVALDELAATPGLEPVGNVLSTNPGIDVDPDQFEEVFFKGGSEPGVLFGAWLGRRPDGSRVVFTGGDADETVEVSPAAFLLLALGLTVEEP